jgi:hypothetical protein
VAIAARNCYVASAESKRSFVVPAQAECGGQKLLQGVAILAAIEMGRDGELPGMFIGVAVGATLKFHLVKRFFAFRKVTLPALQRGMFALQGIRGLRVFLEPKLRRFKTIDAVAG